MGNPLMDFYFFLELYNLASYGSSAEQTILPCSSPECSICFEMCVFKIPLEVSQGKKETSVGNVLPNCLWLPFCCRVSYLHKMKRLVLPRPTFHARHRRETKATFRGPLQVRVETSIFKLFGKLRYIAGFKISFFCSWQ